MSNDSAAKRQYKYFLFSSMSNAIFTKRITGAVSRRRIPSFEKIFWTARYLSIVPTAINVIAAANINSSNLLVFIVKHLYLIVLGEEQRKAVFPRK
mgnify:CR=1 FL=1